MPRIYKIYDPDNFDWPVKFRKTQSDAAACVKAVSDPDARQTIQVDLMDMKADLENLLYALNGDHDVIDAPVIKSWRGTPRGGLRDLSESRQGANLREHVDPQDFGEGPAATESAAQFWDRLNKK